MPVLKVPLGERGYHITIRRDILHTAGACIPRRFYGHAATIITNNRIAPLYLETAQRAFSGCFTKINTIIIPDGERYKTVTQVRKLYRQLAMFGLDRESPILALGGGVVGDIAGFAAATFLRGLPVIQVPTTLLAQVDSSVGGKTGVNLEEGKNLVGAFYQPAAVIIDPEVLQTLPRRELVAGMAEVIKYALIRGGPLLDILNSLPGRILPLPMPTMEKMIALCCGIKADIVGRDEREQGLRTILNYGHTIGHAVETLTGYRKFKHGEAVAIGMVAEARIAKVLGLCSRETFENIRQVIMRAGLPTELPDFPAQRYLDVIQRDKKKSFDRMRMVLPKRLGMVIVREFSVREIYKILRDEFKLKT